MDTTVDVLNEKESETSKESTDHDTSSSNVQHITPPAETPSTPPHIAQPLPAPVTPRPSRIRPPAGFYKALNQGERASAVITDLLEASEMDLIDKENVKTYHPIR